MDKLTAKAGEDRAVLESKTSLDALVREGARRMLQDALENEVREYLARNSAERTTDGRQAIVRNGSLPGRDLLTGAGAVPIRQPRVRDQRRKIKFASRILPPYLRRVPSVDALIPVLYLWKCQVLFLPTPTVRTFPIGVVRRFPGGAANRFPAPHRNDSDLLS